MNKAQEWYVMKGAYKFNRAVKSGEPLEEWLDGYDLKMARQFVRQFNRISPITEEMEVWRGTHGSYSFDHYVSTSTSDRVAEEFVGVSLTKDSRGRYRETRTGQLLHITIKPGVKVMCIGGIQQEYVIEPGVKVEEVFNNGEYIRLVVSKE